jgi:hypothetical protein
VLGLPVFDLGGPTLVPAQRLIEQFRRRWTNADDPHALPSFDWSRVITADTAKPLRVWLERHLNPARVSLPASKSKAPELEPESAPTERAWPIGRKLDADALAWNLGHWLARLRPDPRSTALEPDPDSAEHPDEPSNLIERMPTRVWVLEFESPTATSRVRLAAQRLRGQSSPSPGRMIDGNDERLEIDVERPMVMRMLLDPTPANLAWLLLAAYAFLNEITIAITNAHEQEFQRRVATALLDGTLGLRLPPDSSR